MFDGIVIFFMIGCPFLLPLLFSYFGRSVIYIGVHIIVIYGGFWLVWFPLGWLVLPKNRNDKRMGKWEGNCKIPLGTFCIFFSLDVDGDF